jgi:hypothetical protein
VAYRFIKKRAIVFISIGQVAKALAQNAKALAKKAGTRKNSKCIYFHCTLPFFLVKVQML